MVVQESEGRADGEGLQPQGELGELHGHEIYVHAKDATLHHHPLQYDGIGELIGIKHDTSLGLLLQDLLSILFHLGNEGSIGILMQERDGPGGDLIGRRHQEVAAAHGRVHHLQSQKVLDGLQLQHRIAAF